MKIQSSKKTNQKKNRSIPGAKRKIKDSPDKAKQMELQFDKKAFKRIFTEIKRELKAITQSLE